MKCHSQIQPKFQCVSCNLYVDMHLCKHYIMDDYDFKQYVFFKMFTICKS